jgi:hypothetical protein
MVVILVVVDVVVDVDVRFGIVCQCKIQFVLVFVNDRALELPLFGTHCVSHRVPVRHRRLANARTNERDSELSDFRLQ